MAPRPGKHETWPQHRVPLRVLDICLHNSYTCCWSAVRTGQCAENSGRALILAAHSTGTDFLRVRPCFVRFVGSRWDVRLLSIPWPNSHNKGFGDEQCHVRSSVAKPLRSKWTKALTVLPSMLSRQESLHAIVVPGIPWGHLIAHLAMPVSGSLAKIVMDHLLSPLAGRVSRARCQSHNTANSALDRRYHPSAPPPCFHLSQASLRASPPVHSEMPH